MNHYHDTTNFICFKWGDKYGPEDVNRLERSIDKYYRGCYKFHCITENTDGIDSDRVNVIWGNDWASWLDSPVFTAIKLRAMKTFIHDNNIILDLDILIHNDITELVEMPIDKPTFIWCHWTPEWHWDYLVDRKDACFVNSSFVRWEDDTGVALYVDLKQRRGELGEEYNSLDKFIFYEHVQKNGDIKFWDENRFYNYNEPGPWQYKLNPDATVCLFNTSHLVKLGRRHYELDNTPTEHTDIWESYV